VHIELLDYVTKPRQLVADAHRWRGVPAAVDSTGTTLTMSDLAPDDPNFYGLVATIMGVIDAPGTLPNPLPHLPATHPGI
jgi:hypothetical protein